MADVGSSGDPADTTPIVDTRALPDPPGDLATIPPDLYHLAAGTTLWRIYPAGGEHPTTWDAFRHFGPTTNRFDHHLPDDAGRGHEQVRGIYYAAVQEPSDVDFARALTACLGEVFQEDRTVDRGARQNRLVGFRTLRDLALLDLTRHWAIRSGATARIATGPHAWARRWARAIYAAYPALEGLAYRSAYGGGQVSVALFERAVGVTPPRATFDRALADRHLAEPIGRACLALAYHLI